MMMMMTVMIRMKMMMINDSRQKHPASHTSERTFVPRTAIFSSEGALIAITPYDYPQGKPLFEHTPALDNNLNIIAMMTLVTIISMINKITKITRNIK